MNPELFEEGFSSSPESYEPGNDRTKSISFPSSKHEGDGVPPGKEATSDTVKNSAGEVTDDALNNVDLAERLKRCRIGTAVSVPPHHSSRFSRYASTPEISARLTPSHDLFVRRETLSPSEALYQFCVAAVSNQSLVWRIRAFF